MFCFVSLKVWWVPMCSPAIDAYELSEKSTVSSPVLCTALDVSQVSRTPVLWHEGQPMNTAHPL